MSWSRVGTTIVGVGKDCIVVPATYMGTKFNPLLNTVRPICSLLEFTINSPKYLPWVFSYLPFGEGVTEARVSSAVECLLPVDKSFRDSRGFLEAVEGFNRIWNVWKDWSKSNGIKKFNLVCQAAQGALVLAIIYPVKQGWYDTCACVSRNIGSVTTKQVEFGKNVCVFSASVTSLWINRAEIHKQTEVRQQKVAKWNGLEAILTANASRTGNPDALIAVYLDKEVFDFRAEAQAVNGLKDARENALGILNDPATYAACGNDEKAKDALRLEKKEAHAEAVKVYEKAKDQLVHKALWHSRGKRDANWTEYANNELKSALEVATQAGERKAVEKIVTFAMDVIDTQIANCDAKVWKAFVGNCFELSKATIVGLGILKEISKPGFMRNFIFWSSLGVIGVLGFWRLSVTHKYEKDIELPPSTGRV